jgi:acetamidase/formamidase
MSLENENERVHEVAIETNTLHGSFSAAREPVLTVASGAIVRYATLDVGWGLAPPHADGNRPRHEARVRGIPLVGPVAIEGAAPGMALQADIREVRPASWGYTFAGGGDAPLDAALRLDEGQEELMRWQLDAALGHGRSDRGQEISLAPFLGTIGMPCAEAGEQSSWIPRRTGGNVDCKELVAGTTLYLPIEVEGGLVSVGDGHARQGDGEVAGMAIECPMECVEIRYRVRDDMPLAGPRIKTGDAWITLGFGEDLDSACAAALDAMLDLIVEQTGLSRRGALALSSAVVDLRVTQRANPLAGAHAVLAHDAIR